MKKLMIVVLALGCSSLAAAANTTKLEGMVANHTCTVKVNGTIGSVVVQLPTVSVEDLANAWDAAGLTKFSIEVSNCDYPGAYVSPRFIGNNLHHTGSLNNLSGPGYARNVVVQVGITPGFFIHLGDQTMNSSYSIHLQGSGANRYGSRDYYVRYYAMAPVTAGQVRASVQYAIVYP